MSLNLLAAKNGNSSAKALKVETSCCARIRSMSRQSSRPLMRRSVERFTCGTSSPAWPMRPGACWSVEASKRRIASAHTSAGRARSFS